MQREKVRVYALARELNMDSKDLLDLCRQHGMDVKNQLSSLDPEQKDQIELLVKRGTKVGVAVASPAASSTAVLPTNLDRKVRVLAPIRRTIPGTATAAPAQAAPAAPGESIAPQEVSGGEQESPPAFKPEIPSPSAPPVPAAETPQPPSKPVEPAEPAASPPPAMEIAPVKPEVPPAARSAEPAVGPLEVSARVPTIPGGKPPTLGQAKPDAAARSRSTRQIRPTPTVARPPLAAPPPLKKPAATKKPEEKPVQTPIAKPAVVTRTDLTREQIQEAVKQVISRQVVPPAAEFEVEGDELEGDAKKKARPGGIPGREQRHKKRSQAQEARKKREAELIRSGRVADVVADDDEPQRHRKAATKVLLKRRSGPQPRKGKVPVTLPITVRALSEAIGQKAGDLLFKLRDHGAPPTITINSTVDPLLAEVVAHDAGCDLEIKKGIDVEAQVLADLEKPDQPADLLPRPPIVTIMGHVDHGKTTLLDKIRSSDIAATEVGGITQVIRAWRVEHHGRSITFLDTPGHEAFTKMRARGANVTDIAVIVVAADDGVMPQTEEAINHAKAAGVSMVVCINKVDLPNANVLKTRQQLYSLGLLPDNMGGDIPFVETSAVKGTGIDDLLDNILVLAEVKELKANPAKPARGHCLEAMLSEGEGILATLLVRDGVLKRGDVILCGTTYGRVRAMYDDHRRPITEAGPSTPVRITGLNDKPDPGEAFQVVPDAALGREIAEKRDHARRMEAVSERKPVTLEMLTETKVPELKIILKADFQGSIEAIKKELDKLATPEVRIHVLHSAIGGITESDVDLALTSPQDTIIVGFNAVPDERARALAEERGIQIRQYNIIYNLTDEIRQALAGKLKPHEQVVHLGRAVVRKTFKIGRVGTVAGCFVTEGVIERSAKVRLIRGGVVIYPPPDRTAGLDSLKRFKEDVREVSKGFECGLKIAGYDDIKQDDVIEAYKIEQVQRTLDSNEKK